MNKKYSIIIILIITLSMFVGCDNSKNPVQYSNNINSEKLSDDLWDEAVFEFEKGNLSDGIDILNKMSPDSIKNHKEYSLYLDLAKKYVDSKWNGEWQNPGFASHRITKIVIKNAKPYIVWEIENSSSHHIAEFPEDTYDTIYKIVPKGEAGFDVDGNLVLKTDDIMIFPYWNGDTYEFGRVGSGESGKYTSIYNEEITPSIGMTAEEVENSTWGKPSKINKTTTRYGVHEQWVYSSGRYIYLDDGIVTAIQE